MPSWLVAVSYVSIILGFVTAGIIAADVISHPQRMRIMNVVWPVTGLYFPLFALWIYRHLGRPMATDARSMDMDMKDMDMKAMDMKATDQPFWKSIFVSSTHCASGCVLGDIIGAPIVFALGLTLFGTRLFAEYAVEFALAYGFGIAFQYLAITGMRKIAPHAALVDAVKADTLSLVAYEVGMFGWMAIVYFVLMPPHRLDPTMAVFWFMMQIGLVLGFVTTYPANWLLVRSGVKSAM
jgi:Domain of unknown function (DUF4396)